MLLGHVYAACLCNDIVNGCCDLLPDPLAAKTLVCSQMRLDRIKALRWQGRSLPDDVQKNLSTAELQVC